MKYFPRHTYPERVLVVCTRRIGDVLLTTPLLRSLKRAWPKARLDVLLFRGTEGILEGNPDIADIIVVAPRAGFGERLSEIRRMWRRYDLALSPVSSDRARWYCWVAGRRRIGMIDSATKDRAKTLLLNDWLTFDDLNTHTVTMALRLAEQLDLPLCREVVPPAPKDGGAKLPTLLASLNGIEYAVIHPYPKFRYKMWRTEAWVEVGHWLWQHGLGVVLTGGPDRDETDYVNAIAAQLPRGTLDLSGALSLAETAEVIRSARLFIGPDTAVTHIAAATGTPTVALFGPSNPVKWGPWPSTWNRAESPWPFRGGGHQGNVLLIQGPGECVPCRQEGCDRHVNSASNCLQNIEVPTVIAAAEQLLA
jgi:heptosyltransferase-3